MIPKEDFLVNPKKLYNKLKELIDKYRENIETNDTFYYKYLLEEIRNTNFWNIYLSSNSICMHIHKNGKRAGEICGNKIFVKTDNKLQKYLCSRHCRDYIPKGRIYNENRKRCSFIRNNGNMCKHICKQNNNYCYIHKKEEEHIESLEIAPHNFNNSNMDKDLFLERLKNKRKLYLLKKKIKRINNKNINNIISIKIISFLKIPIFSEKYKKVNKYINYNINNNLTGIT